MARPTRQPECSDSLTRRFPDGEIHPANQFQTALAASFTALISSMAMARPIATKSDTSDVTTFQAQNAGLSVFWATYKGSKLQGEYLTAGRVEES